MYNIHMYKYMKYSYEDMGLKQAACTIEACVSDHKKPNNCVNRHVHESVRVYIHVEAGVTMPLNVCLLTTLNLARPRCTCTACTHCTCVHI